jgi:hypothetical protein
MKNRKFTYVKVFALAVVFSAALLTLTAGKADAAVFGTVTPLTTSGQTVKAISNPVALFKLSLGTDESSKVISDITIGFTGTGFATTDLLPATAGVLVYQSIDGTFDATGETVLNTILTWTSATASILMPPGLSIEQGTPSLSYFIAVKTSTTIATTDVIMATIPINGINTDGANDLPVSATPLVNALSADIVPPAAINVSQFVFQQNASTTHDFISKTSTASVGIEGDVIKVYTAGDVLLGQATFNGAGYFAPIDVGDNQNASVKIQVVDNAGNTSGAAITKTGNDITTPTVTSISVFTDRVAMTLSENVDGMKAMDCSHYTVNGSALTCSGPGTPFVEFQGNKITIKSITPALSGTISFAVVATGPTTNITDINGGANPLTYSSSSISVGSLTLPTVDLITPKTGAPGDTVTITGSNFGAGPAGDNFKVFFSGGFSQQTGPLPPIEATSISSWSATSITAVVPAGASGGPVNVMVSGLMSDMGQNTFFDILKPYTFKIFYNGLGAPNAMPDVDAASISVAIGSPSGMRVYSTTDTTNILTYTNATDEFSIATVSNMGWTWAFDTRGAYLNSNGAQIDTSATQSIVLVTATRSISGTITLGSPCAAGGQNQWIAVMAMPEFQEQSGGGGQNGPMNVQPSFFKTNSSCVATYGIGVINNGVYRVEANIPPDMSGSSSVSSSPFISSGSLSVTINDTTPTATGKNFTFTSANRRIYGTLKGPDNTNISETDLRDMFVGAYQPIENGKGTMTKPTLVSGVAKFVLYVSEGTWKVNVNGPKIPFPVEAQYDVTSVNTLTATLGPTIVISPPSDFIEGYVRDSAGNGLSNVSIYSWREGGPGGGGANTDSQGYYKIYTSAGTGYHVGANSRDYGFLGEQTSITVSGSNHPTVNFSVTSSGFYTISGTVTKGGVALPNAFVFVTQGQFGPGLGGNQTNSSGVYSFSVKPLSATTDYYIHVGVMGKGDLYLGKVNVAGNATVITGNITSNDITITSDTVDVRISPSSLFTQAFVGVHSTTGGAFTDTDLATSGNPFRQYKLDVQRPSSGTTTYYLDGGIPGYGPLPQMEITLSSAGVFGGNASVSAAGIVTIVLNSNMYEVSGTVSGDNVLGARVWAGGPAGGADTTIASTSGAFSIKLRAGTYDIGVNKPGYSGNKINLALSAATTTIALTLSANTSSIAGTVYLPDGTTPASNAWVWATDGAGGWSGSPTDASGVYSLGVTAGDWTIDAAGDGYTATSRKASAGATGVNITLTAIAGFDPKLQNSPMTPSSGGIVQGEGVKVDFPQNSLGTDTNSGTVEVKKTTNIPKTDNMRIIGGSGKEITAKTSTGQAINTLSSAANITLTLTRTEATDSGLTFDELKTLKISYWDSTSSSWSEIQTVTTLNPATATTIAGLDADPAITMVGTVTHLSTFAPTLPTNIAAPGAPTGVTATAGNGSVALSWTASSGATKYDIYQKSGTEYPYLAQTTSTSYTVSSLTNGTEYTFKVSALNASDQESAASSAVSATPAAPVVASSGGGTWIPPVTTPAPTPTPIPTPTPAGQQQAQSQGGATLLRVEGDYRVYVVNNGVKSWVKTLAEFNAKGYKWENVSVVKAGVLGAYPDATESAADAVAKGATLLRAEGDHKVYVINNGSKTWIKTAEEFTAKGLKWEDVVVVKSGDLASYPEAAGATVGGKVKVKVSKLNVRSEGSVKGKILTKVTLGQLLDLMAESNGWFKIKLANGTEGWVSGQYSAKQ